MCVLLNVEKQDEEKRTVKEDNKMNKKERGVAEEMTQTAKGVEKKEEKVWGEG